MNDQNEQKKEREPSNVRKIVCAGIFSLYCACAFILGRQLEANSSIDWRLLTVVKIVALAAILTFLVSKLFAWLNARKPISKTEFTLTTKWKVIAVLVLIIPQIVALLIMYPGCYGYDGGNHLIQYVDENRPLRKDLSVIYTVFLGLLTETFQSVKSITFGLALAMLIQSLISVFALYQLVKFVTQKTKSKCAYFFTLLFSALFPFAIILRASTSQDVLFGAFFLLSAIELYKIGETLCKNGAESKSDLKANNNLKIKNPLSSNNPKFKSLEIKKFVPFCIWACLMMLMRNTGAYMIVFAIIVSLPFIWKKKSLQTLCALLAPVIMFFIISGPVYSALGVQPSNITISEMSSLPSQQLTRAHETSPDSFSEEEAQLFNSIFSTGKYNHAADDTSWYWSQSEIADVAKARLSQDFVKSNLKSVLRLYISTGLECPKAYTDAFFMNTLGFWYPCKTYPDERMYHPYFEYETIAWGGIVAGCPDIPRSSFFPDLDSNIANFLKAGWGSTNPLTIVLKCGSYLLIFVFCATYAIYSRRRNMFFVFGLFLSLFVTLFLSPVSLFRYAYPLVITTPLLFLVFTKKQDCKIAKLHAYAATKIT